MMKFLPTHAWLIVLLTAVGCDRPKPPPSTSVSPPVAQQESRPTTQELLNGTYRNLPLPGMPLALQVPASWSIDAAAGLTFVKGPTPAATATIQLALRDTFRPDQLDMLVERTRLEAAQRPQAVRKAELHTLGRMKVLERLEFSAPVTSPLLDAAGNGILDRDGNLQTITFTPVRWTWMVMIPNRDLFDRYELNFIDLTAEQFDADRELLEKILRSLSHQAAMAPIIDER